MQSTWDVFKTRSLTLIKAIAQSLFTWSWCKKTVYWLIISGGTMSELAFLAGAVWMSLNATVHPFILMFLREDQTRYLSFLATSAYVALPELIVSLAVIVTVGHIRLFFYDRKNLVELVWIALYGLPAIFFAAISAYTIAQSVSNPNFTMPEIFIVSRALAGYLFAFTSLLYWKLGEPQEVERLRKKDTDLSDLRREMESKLAELETENQRIHDVFISETSRLNGIIQDKNRELEQQKRQHCELQKAVKESSDAALQGYSEECLEWLRTAKTAPIETASQYIGVSVRRLNNAIERGELQHTPRNKKIIVVSSLVSWLKSSERRLDTSVPLLHVVNE